MHQWSQTVLIQSEPLLQSPGPHGLVEHVTASEVEDSTVVLIVRDDSDVKSSVKMIIRQATHSHELGVSLTCVGFC